MTDVAGSTPEASRIERDLAQTRARLDSTIDALQDKLAPGQMVDQAVAYLKESGGGEFGRNMMVAVRDNPIPVALVGVGLAWLMVSSASRSAGEERHRRQEDAVERYRGRGGDVGRADARSYVGATAAASYPGVGRTTAAYPARPTATTTAALGDGGSDDPGLEGRLAREEGYLTQRGAYASAAVEDLATKANAAGTAVRRDPGEADDAYEGRVYAAKGGVLGLRRSEDEPHAGFRARVEAAVAAAAERYERARARAATMGGDMAGRGQSAMQNLSGYGRAAAGYGRSATDAAYGYGRSAAEGAYGYGQVAARSIADHPLPYALVGAGIAWLLLSGRLGGGDRRRRPYEAMRYYGGRGPDFDAPGAGYASGDGDRYAYQGDRYAGYGRTAGGGYGRTETTAYGGTSVYGYDEDGDRVEDLASRAHAAGSAVGRASDEDEEAYRGRVYAARGKVLGLAQDAGETLSAFRERVDAALADAGERYARWRDQAAAAAGRLGARGQDAAQGLYGYGRGAAGQAWATGGRAVGYVQDQPWLMGLLGFGAGALLGMLTAPSRYEREMMRGVGDDVRERFRDVAEDAMESASRVAREVVGAARESAGREGLTDVEVPSASGLAHAARGKVQDAATRVRHVVEETAAAGRAAVEREIGGGSAGNGSSSTGTTTTSSSGQARKDEGKPSPTQVGGGVAPSSTLSGGSGGTTSRGG